MGRLGLGILTAGWILIASSAWGAGWHWPFRHYTTPSDCLKVEVLNAVEEPLSLLPGPPGERTELPVSAPRPVILSRVRTLPSERTLAVPEGGVRAARPGDPNVRFLTTSGLVSCVGVVVRDATNGVGAIGHFVALGTERYSAGQFVLRLEAELHKQGGKLQGAEVTLVWGNKARDEGETGLERLVDALKPYQLGSLQMDSQVGTHIRSIGLDLSSGSAFEYVPDQDRRQRE